MGRPRIMAIDVPVTIMLRASCRCSGGAMRTAMGDTIDQNTACVHATPKRLAMSMVKLVDENDMNWNAAIRPIMPSISLRRSTRVASTISGSDSSITAQA